MPLKSFFCTLNESKYMHINFEFKARSNNINALEEKIKNLSGRFVGEDHQTDTYFHVPNGRLKLREGNIENALIYYQRTNTAGAKQSDVTLYQHQADANLKAILMQSLGIKTVVEKKRRIYFIENVKFHFDQVTGLGSFVEVEAIDADGTIGIEKLKEQCKVYEELFDIQPDDFMADSYSDLLLSKV